MSSLLLFANVSHMEDEDTTKLGKPVISSILQYQVIWNSEASPLFLHDVNEWKSALHVTANMLSLISL